jgi:hypothetical protein
MITTFIYEGRTTHVNRTNSRIYRFIYIDSYTDILNYYTHFVLMNFTSEYTTDINRKYTHGHCTLYIYRFMHRYTVHILYRWTVLLCTQLYNVTLPKHTLVVHKLCLDQLYCCTFIL